MGREVLLSQIVQYHKERKNTIFLVSHSMEEVAKYADRILVLNRGQVYLYGTVEEVFGQAEKLFDASLDLPQITKLFIELKKRSLCAETDVYTIGYAKKQLERMLEC